MTTHHQTILIHPDAPVKPVPGAPCNGCGVCCLLAPCPLGMVLSRRRKGACVALRWQDEGRYYRCGAICAPVSVVQGALPAYLQRGAPWLAPLLASLAKRWIAAGQGCDSTVEPMPPIIRSYD